MKPSKTLKITKDNESDEDNIMFEEPIVGDDHMINIDKLLNPKQLETKEYRRIQVPQHRYTPLRNSWEKITTTIVENLNLDIRMNTKRRCVELRTNKETKSK